MSMKPHLLDGDSIHHLVDGTPELLDQVLWPAIDLVLMEIKMKSRNGLELIPEIRKRKQGLPIVIVTAGVDKDSCIKAINGGVNGLIEKPLKPELFTECLNRFRSTGYELKMCRDRKAIYSQNHWVDLTSTEYKILETLKTAAKRLTRAELQSAVWPNSSISENNLDTHLTNLKRKIPELNSILNVKRGLGYYLEPKRTQT